MQIKKCLHGNAKNIRICISPLCSSPAFASMACGECLELHEHEGLTTLRKLDLMEAEIGTLSRTSDLLNPKVEEIKQGCSYASGEVTKMMEWFKRDSHQLLRELVIKPKLAVIVERLQSHDKHLEGADICLLIEAIKNNSLYESKTSVEEKISALARVYFMFLDRVDKLTDGLEQKRKQSHQRCPAKAEREKEAKITTQAIEAVSKPPGYEWRAQKVETDVDSEEEVNWIGRVAQENSKIGTPAPAESIQIKDIVPNMTHLSFVAKVVKVEQKSSVKAIYVRCWLADETATIEGSFPYHQELKAGAVLEFTNIKSIIVRQTGRLCLNTTHSSTIKVANEKITETNTSLNMSRLIWMAVEEQSA